MRRFLFWTVLALAILVGGVATLDRSRQVGRPFAGFWIMDNLLVAIGGAERGGLEPFDLVRVMNGQVLTSGRQIQAEVASHPPGTTFHYMVYRRGGLVEADVPTRLTTRRDFLRFLGEGLLPGLLTLAFGALVFVLKPGVPQSWVFLGFSLVSYLVSVTYADAHTTYRLTPLFLTAWAFWPATFIHLALIFPQRRRVVRRHPHIVWLPYLVSAASAVALQLRFAPQDVLRFGVAAGAGAAYWGLSLILLVLALARTSLAGVTPLMRARARVIGAAFAVGYLPPVLGTVVEAVLRVPVPALDTLWRLNFVFPAVMAYAMVRYDLFDVRSALRTGTIYSVVTGLVVLAYAGAIALLDLAFTGLGFTTSPVAAAGVVAFGVVVFLNPIYRRTQRVVDRVFFRQRVDVERSIERVAELMTGLLDLGRIESLIARTVEEQLHPSAQFLFLEDEARQGYVLAGEEDPEERASGSRVLAADSPLPRCLARVRGPVSRERVEEDPALRDLRDGCLAELDTLKVELLVPVLFQRRLTGFLALGPKRSGGAYSTHELRLLRLLLNQSALALDHARAYAALEAMNKELKSALRRVELLESIRANLSKFVPKTVQDLIERAPDAPALDKREADVSVLFVDIAGYTRLSERLDPVRVNELIERYFGSFLDEILKRGGDVNETAGDGLMVIFQDADPRRHARSAVKTALAILQRTREINATPTAASEPIALHVGVNSGVATVGATKIEGVAGTRWTYTASGPVTNLAARLAGLGSGDVVMVGAETRRRLDGEFAFETLGEQTLRNLGNPVSVFRLTLDSPSVTAREPTPAGGAPRART